jgi:hypothetical protein
MTRKTAQIEMQAMFDRAWESLAPEEREAERQEREALLRAYAGNGES